MKTELKCKVCGSIYVVNKTHKLCNKCNQFRLQEIKDSNAKISHKKEINTIISKKKKPLKSSKETTKKRKETLIKDRETYLKVFNTKLSICEECGILLPDIFEEDNRIVFIAQYSHILTKAAHPELRHEPENFNRLCLNCHQKWEFGNREIMNIYTENLKIIEKLKQRMQ